MRYSKIHSSKVSHQSVPILGREVDMVQNNAGGYSFKLDKWKVLDRFLILGSEGGTYYVKEHKLTVENVQNVLECIKEDGIEVVNRAVNISQAGRAPKNDSALYVMALVSAFGNDEAKAYVRENLNSVARIGTHIFQFVEAAKSLRGWGRGLKSAVSNWYLDRPLDSLGYQVIKYQQRYGWSHKDLLRLAHTVPATEGHDNLFAYIVGKQCDFSKLPKFVQGFELAKNASTKAEVITLIQEYGLTREMIPTEFLKDAEVWEALLEKMPITAMVRNLGNMTKCGLIGVGQWNSNEKIINKLLDHETLKKARVHPLNLLVAYKTYGSSGGFRSNSTWIPVPDIMEALEKAFYLSFEFAPSTNKRWVLGIDVSGSMSQPVPGTDIISCAEAAATLAMVAYKQEKYAQSILFTRTPSLAKFTRNSTFNEVLEDINNRNFGGTDCALPILWADHNNVEVDAFLIATDNETWAGKIHPKQALDQYRNKTGIDSKLIVIGMTATNFSIADPTDSGMLDVAGFDSSVPAIISEFVGAAE